MMIFRWLQLSEGGNNCVVSWIKARKETKQRCCVPFAGWISSLESKTKETSLDADWKRLVGWNCESKCQQTSERTRMRRRVWTVAKIWVDEVESSLSLISFSWLARNGYLLLSKKCHTVSMIDKKINKYWVRELSNFPQHIQLAPLAKSLESCWKCPPNLERLFTWIVPVAKFWQTIHCLPKFLVPKQWS